MLSFKTQKKIFNKIPPYPPWLYLRRFLKLCFLIKNFLFEIKEKILWIIFKIRHFFIKDKVNVTIEGFNFSLIPKGSIAFQIWRQKTYEKEVTEFLLSEIKKGNIFFDVRANVGFFSILAGLKEKSSQIYAFEPATETFKVLEENIKINNLKNVKTFKMAIGNYNGETFLNLNPEFRDGLNTLGKGTHPGCKIIKKEKVKIITLDKFAEENNISKIDIIKVDVEGAELFVFEGAKKILSNRNGPLIIYESSLCTTKGFSYHPVEIMWFLSQFGYQFFVFDKKNEIVPFDSGKTSFDNIIIAKKLS